jgi:hypothetical protein
MGRVSDLADLLAQQAPPERTPSTPDLPKGWEPGVRWSNDTGVGTITTSDVDREPDAALWAEIIRDWQFDPDVMEIIDGSIELIGWDSPIKGTDQSQRLRRYKAKFRQRAAGVDRVDIDALCAMVMKRRPRKLAPVDNVDRSLVVLASDWQVGKGEGDGTAGTVDRIAVSMDRTVARIRELRRIGRGVDVAHLVGLGDLLEQNCGFYPSQQYTTDLTRREQMRVVRRLLIQFVDALVGCDVAVVLTGVAGNHGENRGPAGKAYTTVDDNDDLAVIEQVAEVLAANPSRYGAVSTYLPSELSMCIDVAGVPVGAYHGHLPGSGANPQAKIENWWKGQVMGIDNPVRDARLLFTGHYHHLTVSESSGRTHFQSPAMDPGSAWFKASTGQSSPSGMLTVGVGTVYGPRGWGDLEVL